MPPNRKVVLKRWRRPGRKALLTFAGLFTVIRVEQMFAERSPANEVGRVVRASGSRPARQRRVWAQGPGLFDAGSSPQRTGFTCSPARIPHPLHALSVVHFNGRTSPLDPQASTAFGVPLPAPNDN